MTATVSQSPPPTDPLAELIERATAADGQPPFSDQSLVELERGERSLIDSPHGVAVLSADELELVVDPPFRGQGNGTVLLDTVLAARPSLEFAWAHGDHPASRALAARFSFEPVRTLLQLRAPVAESGSLRDGLRPPQGAVGFRPGIDDAAWLALNALAFSSHPEQGRMTQRDLDARMAEPWFDPEDFLLLWDDGALAAFCWLKVDGPIGEFYAVGVDPARQGQGLGRVLMDAGFSRLAERSIREAALYVEADNEPALKLYERYGFTRHTIDVRYRRRTVSD